MTVSSVEEYVASIPQPAQQAFSELRSLVEATLDSLVEEGLITGWSSKISYGVLGFAPAGSRGAKVFVAGYGGHVALYPVPQDPDITKLVAPYRHGKGTLRFSLTEPLPADLIPTVTRALVTS